VIHADEQECILVVEDDDDIRETLADLLEREGYDVATARDGIEAVEALEHCAPAMVISDVRMPRRDGFELLGDLRARIDTADLPVVLLSGSTERKNRIDGLDLGADDYIAKPVDPEELFARIRMHLRHAHRERELERRTLIDPLTGVLNRRGLMEVLRHEHERVRRLHETALSVLLIDIDRFKMLNDTRGHEVGDRVLRHLAATLLDAVRACDHIGRLGGDEFVVVTPDAGHDAASALAGRLSRLEVPPVVPGGAPLEVGMSIGVATLREDESVESLLARADARMYGRKRRRASGRG
jgi:diguanylate cyclase (GGDEF)-like protein